MFVNEVFLDLENNDYVRHASRRVSLPSLLSVVFNGLHPTASPGIRLSSIIC
jgi:hypothetical protein